MTAQFNWNRVLSYAGMCSEDSLLTISKSVTLTKIPLMKDTDIIQLLEHGKRQTEHLRAIRNWVAFVRLWSFITVMKPLRFAPIIRVSTTKQEKWRSQYR